MHTSIIDQIQDWYNQKQKIIQGLSSPSKVPGNVYAFYNTDADVREDKPSMCIPVDTLEEIFQSPAEFKLWRTINTYLGDVEAIFENEFFDEDPNWTYMFKKYYGTHDDEGNLNFNITEIDKFRSLYPSQFENGILKPEN